MSVDLVVLPNPEEAATIAATLLADTVRAGESLVLAGGSTPRRAYELAARLEPDWSGVELWFGDERCVPPDDPRSNARLVHESLLAHLAKQPGAVHAVPTQLDPKTAAEAYDAALQGVSLGLVLLGLGADGHTASLFPHAPSLQATGRLVVAAEPGLEPFVPRVTLTVPALASGRRVVFLAVGADKAGAALRAFGEPPSFATPASLVRSTAGTTTVILDEAAASLLHGRSS